MIILEATNLLKVYEGKSKVNSTRALNNLNLKVENGEFIAIMGPSGSGKTTLLNILNGIDVPTSGHVKICDNNINDLTRDELALFRRKRLGFVFQEFNLLDSLSVKENIMLPLILDNVATEKMEEEAISLLKLFNIKDIANKFPYTISGGQQQRAAVARAIINNPAIVFADEPTGNLDSKSAKDVMDCFKKMNEEKESTILIVTHDAFTASYCKKVVFLKDGSVHMEIINKGDRKDFFIKILDCLAIIGGYRNDI